MCTIQFRKLLGDRWFLASRTPSSASSVSYSTVANFWNATYHPFCYYAIQYWKCSRILCYIQDNLENIYTYLSSMPDDERHLSVIRDAIYAIYQLPAILSPMWTNNIHKWSIKYKLSAIACTKWVCILHNVKLPINQQFHEELFYF